MVSLLLHQHQLRCENLQNCAGNEYIPTIDFSTPRGGGDCWELVRRVMMLVRSGCCCARGDQVSGRIRSNRPLGASGGNSHGRWFVQVRAAVVKKV